MDESIKEYFRFLNSEFTADDIERFKNHLHVNYMNDKTIHPEDKAVHWEYLQKISLEDHIEFAQDIIDFYNEEKKAS